MEEEICLKEFPKKPKNIKSAYIFFTQEQIPKMVESGASYPLAFKQAAAKWQTLKEEEKEPYLNLQ